MLALLISFDEMRKHRKTPGLDGEGDLLTAILSLHKMVST